MQKYNCSIYIKCIWDTGAYCRCAYTYHDQFSIPQNLSLNHSDEPVLISLPTLQLVNFKAKVLLMLIKKCNLHNPTYWYNKIDKCKSVMMRSQDMRTRAELIIPLGFVCVQWQGKIWIQIGIGYTSLVVFVPYPQCILNLSYMPYVKPL